MCPADRNRTDDPWISTNLLQSIALPTELPPDMLTIDIVIM